MEKVQLPAMQTAGVAIEERLALFKEFNQLYRNQNGNMLANLFGQSLSRKDERNGGRELSGYNLLGSVSLSVQSDVRDMP